MKNYFFSNSFEVSQVSETVSSLDSHYLECSKCTNLNFALNIMLFRVKILTYTILRLRDHLLSFFLSHTLTNDHQWMILKAGSDQNCHQSYLIFKKNRAKPIFQNFFFQSISIGLGKFQPKFEIILARNILEKMVLKLKNIILFR